MITIVNYGLGNVGAFCNMYKRMNVPTKIATQVSGLEGATHLILPGVGSFDHAMAALSSSGLRDSLDDLVLNQKAKILGVCIGMQMLAETSEEGLSAGLGWMKGKVRSFSGNDVSSDLPMPHMGWNDVKPALRGELFSGIEDDARFYFLHSYYFDCDHSDDVVAVAHYGFDFPCAIRRNNIYGVQFHPEKSHQWGACLLKNYAEI